MTRARSLLTLLASASLLAGPAARAEEEHHLHQWVDKEGVTHLTLAGPTKEALARAKALTLVPQATGQTTHVHEVSDWDFHIAMASEKYNIPKELVRAIIVAESNFHPDAISHVGARGLMQLMPGTGSAMYVENPFDPVQNIYGGTRYLRILANMFQGDLTKTVAAYNAGPEAVRKAAGVPMIAETQNYVRKVVRLYKVYKGID